MVKIAGLSKKALAFITKNSKFLSGRHIGCSHSDGIIQTTAYFYKTAKVTEEESIFLFKYILKNGTATTNVQEIKNDIVFISLLTDYGKEFRWSKKDITEFITNNKKEG